ncbi:holo-ACP synthase [Cardiobacteriaceae bacterium TAE3-ERU3]|nr:holo-ACP synthase [Cardiobacteriaceae bacterium TAE3-ERU3]
MIGTDLTDKRRIAAAYARHGQRFAEKVLHPDEIKELAEKKDPVRYLSMRWAAKEAFGKALGSGLRDPVLMPNIRIIKSELGAPSFAYSDTIEAIIKQQGFTTLHLSLSDEADYALAFVMAERKSK